MAHELKSITYSLDRPKQVATMASILKNHIIKNNLYVNIVGKNYVQVEGWQFAGGLLGLLPRIASVEQLGDGVWKATAEIVDKNGRVVSTGFALCSKAEAKKKTFEEYAILSMAQTRAIGKAYRNLLGWVIKMSGYEGTPAEEMQGIKVQTAEEEKPSDENRTKKIAELKAVLKGKTDTEKISDLKKRTGIVIKGFGITEKHAGILIASLLNSEVQHNA